MTERSEAKSAKRKIYQILIFDGKLRFALLASLRLGIFSETQVDNLLVTWPAEVKNKE